MFRGKAHLDDPQSGRPVATFIETRESDGTVIATVHLRYPITLRGRERLAIISSIDDREVIVALARNGEPTELHHFDGASGLGCLPAGTAVTLIKSLGGPPPSGMPRMVLGRGVVQQERH